jgi:hypothetical protein
MKFEKSLIDKTKVDTYPLEIYIASNNNENIPKITISLIKTIREIYQYFEPNHFKGELVICSTLDSSVIKLPNKEILFDKSVLMTIRSKTLLIQKTDNELLLWKNTNIKSLLNKKNILFYFYKNKKEYFRINNKEIILEPMAGKFSVFSSYYYSLSELLNNYSLSHIYHSSCEHFKPVWADEKRIYFINKPEKTMHKSLEEYLKSTLRGVDVEINSEFNTNAKNPVDLRVHWRTANRCALIEIKWLGASLDIKKTKIKTTYSKARAIAGAKQLKEYLELAQSDTPGIIIKGYLVVIDGRRKINRKGIQKTISEKDGLHYESDEITYPDEYDLITKFEPPLRMFARPICQ